MDLEDLEFFEDGCGDVGCEGGEDGVFLAAVFGDVAGERILGALAHVF
jgi:hypothetical protein